MRLVGEVLCFSKEFSTTNIQIDLSFICEERCVCVNRHRLIDTIRPNDSHGIFCNEFIAGNPIITTKQIGLVQLRNSFILRYEQHSFINFHFSFYFTSNSLSFFLCFIYESLYFTLKSQSFFMSPSHFIPRFFLRFVYNQQSLIARF